MKTILNMKIKNLKYIIKEHIKVLKEQDDMTLHYHLISPCVNDNITPWLFSSDENPLIPTFNATLDIDIQNSLQQQFYQDIGSPNPGQAVYFEPLSVCVTVTPAQATLPNFTDVDGIGLNNTNSILYPIDDVPTLPDFYVYDSCDECMGGCSYQIEADDQYGSWWEFCAKCDSYDFETNELAAECCPECEGMEKYKCAASGGGVSATYEQSCVATWESDAPFNTLEECQTSGCGQMDLIGQEPCSGGFSCQDFLDFDGPLPNFQQTICTYFCNPWGSAVSPGLANFLLPYIPCLENWETPTGPDFADYNIATDNSGYEYTGTFSQGYYNPGGLCDMGCCDGEGLIAPYGEWIIGDNDYCNDDVGGGWDYQAFYSWPQDEQDITCAMCNNGGSIEVEFLGSPVTLQLPYNLGPLYCPCCPETGGMPGPDGMALLSKKLNKNSINKLQNKLKKYSQQLSKEDPQKTRMQELANIKNKK